MIEQFGTTVFGVCQHQGDVFPGSQNLRRQVEQFGSRLRYGAGGGGRREADGLLRIGIKDPESLRCSDRFLGGPRFADAHVPFAEAAHPMRIDDQQFSEKIAANEPQFSQRHLQLLSAADGLCGQ